MTDPKTLQASVRAPFRRLALFLDGTWNDHDDNTNVWRLHPLTASRSTDGVEQLIYYDKGPNGLAGGILGKGVGANVLQAYEWLVQTYNEGDEIFLFGFSRGAFTTRSLAGFVTKCGLLQPGAPVGTRQLFERYSRNVGRTVRTLAMQDGKGTTADFSIMDRLVLKYCRPISIEMVGVWDTVGALGVPAFRIRNVSRSRMGWHHTGLRLPIQHGFHAVAIDEHRPTFKPTLWTVNHATEAPPRTLEQVEQRWFVGAHANVGGGYPNDLLVQPPLHWMARKAEALGLAFRYKLSLDGDVTRAPVADSYDDFAKGAYRFIAKRHYRTIGAPTRVDPDQSRHSTVNETIDVSVFDRVRADESYRPPNLMEWAGRARGSRSS